MAANERTWWRCRHCGQVLGEVRGRLLWVGLILAVRQTTPFLCGACGRWQSWYDSEPRAKEEDEGLKSVG